MRGRALLIGILVGCMLPFIGVQTAFAADTTTTYAGPAPNKAVAATLAGPTDVVEAGGSFYISESAHRIRKIASTGDISIAAGNGSAGFVDGTGPATTRLNRPRGIAAFGSDILIADEGNHAVRKLTSSGSLSTLAGTGSPGAAAEAVAAAGQQLSAPADVVADGSTVYIADTGNNKVRKIDAAGLITTFAGDGTGSSGGDGGPASLAQLNAPVVLAIDSSYLYIADATNIRRVELSTGIISTFASVVASGLAVAGGTVYASEASDHRVVEIDSAGTPSVFAGSSASGTTGDGGAANAARFVSPAGLTRSGSDLIVADAGGNRVRRIAAGIVHAFAGTAGGCEYSDGGPAVNMMLGDVTAVAVGSDGSVYLADGCNFRIRRVSSGGTLSTIAGRGALGPASDGPALEATFGGEIGGLAVSGSTVYLSDTANGVVRRISSGQISNVVSVPGPRGLAVDAAGVLYVAASCRVWRLDGSALTTVGGTTSCGHSGADGTSALAAGMRPHGLAVDGTGRIFVAEADNNVVRRINIDGTITTIAGDGVEGYGGDDLAATSAQLFGPTGVAVGAGGIVYIADKWNNRIRRVRGDNIINTAVGTGTPGFTGEGGSGTSAALSSPNGVAIIGRTLYVSDGTNRRIRKVALKDQDAPPLAVTGVTAPIGNASKSNVQVSGTGEKDAMITVTVTNGTTTLAPVTKKVDGAGNWLISPIDVKDFPDGTITFTANEVDKDGNIAAPSSIIGVKDTVGGASVSSLTKEPGNGQVTLKWKNPSDPEFVAAVVRKAPGATPPAAVSDGTEVPTSSSEQAVATGLENCVTYSFSVFARDNGGNFSSPVSTVAQPMPSSGPGTSSGLSVSHGAVYAGGTFRITGSLVRSGTSTPLPGEKVRILIRRAGSSSWGILSEQVMSGTTFTYMHRPLWTADYRLHHPATGCAGASYSVVRTVTVRPLVNARLSAPSVLAGSTATVSGTIQPGQYGGTIYLQQGVSGSWKNVGRAGLWGNGMSFSFTVKPTAARTYYRIWWPGDADAPAAYSGAMTLSTHRATIIGIMFDPKGEDMANLNGEYATVKNTGGTTIDLFGWRLYALKKNKYHTLPHYQLTPGAVVHVRVGPGTNRAPNLFLGRSSTLWTNTHDEGRLYDPRGSLAGVFRY